MLPSLTAATGGTAATPGAGAAGAAATDPNAAAAAGGATAQRPTWLQPLMTIGGPALTIGGGIAAIRGFTKGPGWLKFAGIGAALAGVGMTVIGNRQAGVEQGTKATEQQALVAMQTLQTQYQQAMDQVSNEAATQIGTLQQQVAAQQGGAAGQAGQGGQQLGAPGTAGTGGGATGTGVGPGLDSTQVPAWQGGTGTGTAQGTGAGQGAGTAQSTGGAQATGAWSLQGLTGTTIQLTAGSSATGTEIAEAGTFRIEQPAGDANGYATIDEANAAARQSMSTELMGSRFLRWLVVEHDGRFYGVIAKKLGDSDQPNPLQAAQGNVVAWSAMNHVEENGQPGWQAFSWSQAGGSQSIAVPYGTSNVFGGSEPGVSGGGPSGAGTAPGGTSGIVDQALASVAGGGATSPAVTGAPFDPAAQVGRTFSINASSTAEGALARGGALQVQRFVETSAGGFGTAEEAAQAARQARAAAGGGNQWSRWVTLQGGDGRFYVYEGSIVKRATAELQAAPVHVFGSGFAEFFDATSNAWKAVADQQAA
jgi:hypothetical protein